MGFRWVVAGALLLVQVPGNAQISITVNTGTRYQTIEGFGGNLVFHEPFYGTMPQDRFNELNRLLFHDLRMNLVRVKIPHEIEPVNDNNDPDNINWGNIQPLPDGTIIRMVQAGRAYGHGLKVVAAPWSPPAWMKLNNDTNNGGHLRPGYDAELAEWLRIWLTVWSNLGVPVDILSLQNEPSWNAPYESAEYTPQELATALQVVVPRLRSWGFGALKIQAPDDANTFASLNFTNALNAPGVRSNFDQYAVHTYETPFNSPYAQYQSLVDVANAANTLGKPLWMTEYGNIFYNNPGGGGVTTFTLDEAQYEAMHWITAFNVMNASAYMVWQLADTLCACEPLHGLGLVLVRTNDLQFQIPKRYYYIKQFTACIRPGMKRVGLAGLPNPPLWGSAFADELTGQGVIVLLNPTGNSQSIQLSWPGVSTMYPWRSSATEDFVRLGTISGSGGNFQFTLPANSITSFMTYDDQGLPIQLRHFSARSANNGLRVLVNWGTVSEVNNFGFFVQKRRNNEPDWREIPNSFVAGNGTTNEPHEYLFTDSSTSAGIWQYRLKQVDLDRTVHYTEAVGVEILTGVSEGKPHQFALHQNFPNPFNPTTRVTFSVAGSSGLVQPVKMKVFDMWGREVATLVDGSLPAGEHSVEFNASGLASGVYLCRLESAGAFESRRMVLLK